MGFSRYRPGGYRDPEGVTLRCSEASSLPEREPSMPLLVTAHP